MDRHLQGETLIFKTSLNFWFYNKKYVSLHEMNDVKIVLRNIRCKINLRKNPCRVVTGNWAKWWRWRWWCWWWRIQSVPIPGTGIYGEETLEAVFFHLFLSNFSTFAAVKSLLPVLWCDLSVPSNVSTASVALTSVLRLYTLCAQYNRTFLPFLCFSLCSGSYLPPNWLRCISSIHISCSSK
jgi:hypothetical protein